MSEMLTIERTMLEALRGGYGTAQVTIRRDRKTRKVTWTFEARGERLPPSYGVWAHGETLEEVLPAQAPRPDDDERLQRSRALAEQAVCAAKGEGK